MTCWNKLPLEVQWMILELLAEDCSFAAHPYARARYVSVCHVWQPIFERRNFQQLVIDQWRLSDLNRILDVNQRRDHLEHLCFRVQLEDYGCPRCQQEETENTITNDGQHIFRDFRLRKEYPYRELSDCEGDFGAYRARADKLGLATLHDPYHGWIKGALDADRIPLASRKRVTGEVKYNFGRPNRIGLDLPTVDVVTSLLVRRQFYRKISLESLNKLLRHSLKSVRRFGYEGRQEVTAELQTRTDWGYMAIIFLGHSLPPAVRELSIFEEVSKVLHAEQPKRRKPPSYLGRAFTEATRNLETFSAGFVVDAEDFFHAFDPTHSLSLDETPWTNLRKLSLTTGTFRPSAGGREINQLLMTACRAVPYMPELQLMQLWNGGEGFGYVFCYHGNPRASWITWRYYLTGECDTDETTLRCWEEMEHQKHPDAAPLRHTSSAFRGEVFQEVKAYRPTLQSLTNDGHIISPMSSYQAKWEEENPGLW